MSEYAIIGTDAEIEAISHEWRQLHAELGKSIFTDYDWFLVWWQTLGNTGYRTLHIVTCRQDGKLIALLPLAIIHRKRFRILQTIGAEAFYCCDMLCDTESIARDLWRTALKSPHYDYAHIRDVLPETICEKALSSFATLHDRSKIYSLKLQWRNAEEWKKTLSSKLRYNSGRALRQLNELGNVDYRVIRNPPLPPDITETAVRHKAIWCEENHMTGMFDQPGITQYHRKLAETAAAKGDLVLGLLACGGKTFAWHLMYKFKTTLYSYVVAINAEWNKYSPGNLANIHAISWAIENGFDVYDHMQGDFAYKEKFSNQLHQCCEYTFHHSLRGWLGENIFILRRWLRRQKEKNKE